MSDEWLKPYAPPSAAHIEGLIERIRAKGIDPAPIEHGLREMVRKREPGDDDDEHVVVDEDEELVPIGTLIQQHQDRHERGNGTRRKRFSEIIKGVG